MNVSGTRTWLSAVALAVGVLFGATGAAQAQQPGAITGQVVDANTMQPLAGAQVVIPGTNRGTLTSQEGRYRLQGIRPGEVTVQVILIGYESASQTVQVAAGETTVADFELSTAAVSLDEIVVTATGEQRARVVANAVSSVDASEVTEVAPVVSLTEAIQGQSAGVTVLQSSGTAGTGSSIRIRGNSSISLDNTPLIYVDGVRINNDNDNIDWVGGQTTSRLNDINPEDIERIEVVKGPAASTLYGTEAAAGVIRIFTKQGRPGEPRFTFRTEYGQNRAPVVDYPSNAMNLQEILGFGKDTVYTTNLFDVEDPFRNGTIRTYAGSVRGGTDLLTYYISGEYQDEEGILPTNAFERYYARGNFKIRPSDQVDIDVSAGYTSNSVVLPQNDNNGWGYLGVALLDYDVWLGQIQAKDPNGGGQDMLTCPLAVELARATGQSLSEATEQNCPANVRNQGFGGLTFDDINTLDTQDNVERFTGSVAFTYRPWEFMTNRLTLGYDAIGQRAHFLVPVDPDLPFGSDSRGYRYISNRMGRNLTLDYLTSLIYNPTESISTTTSVGFQYYREILEIAEAEGQVFPAGATTISNAVTTQGFEEYGENKTLGLFLEEQIGWRDILFITPAVRFDDNSAFGRDFEGQVYPKIGASYVISDEDWFPRSGLLGQLKLRAAWGTSGKQPGATAALQTYSTRSVQVRGQDVLSVTPENIGNAELKPETGSEWEAGFDVSLFNSRVGVEFTVYNQTTNDALVLRRLAPSRGFPESRWDNVGQMKNRGFELGTNILALQRENAQWDLVFNFSKNSNEITELEEPIIFGLGGSSQRHTVGHPFASYFSEELTIDENGDVVASDTAVFLGHPTPEWEGSVASSLTLFDYVTLYALVDFKGGHQLFNSTEEFRCGFAGLNLCPEVHEMNADGELTDEAKIKRYAAAEGIETPWIEDADFAKLRTVSLRLRLPGSWAEAFGARNASISLAGQNLKTWTGYTGLDPEINFAGAANATRAEFLTLPTQRRFVTTVQVTF